MNQVLHTDIVKKASAHYFFSLPMHVCDVLCVVRGVGLSHACVYVIGRFLYVRHASLTLPTNVLCVGAVLTGKKSTAYGFFAVLYVGRIMIFVFSVHIRHLHNVMDRSPIDILSPLSL